MLHGRRRLAIVLCLVLAGGSAAGHAGAQAAEMAGRYALDREASDDVRAAIETSIAGMSFLTRPIARARLRTTNPVGDLVAIELNRGCVRVTFAGSPPMNSTDDGTTIRWRREDGEEFDLRTEWQGDALVQTISAEEGVRTNRFALSAGGAGLDLSVTIHSPRLPRPLEYRLVYRRSPG